VPAKSLVLDANILIRAVLGRRVREVLERHGREVEFLAPDVSFQEAACQRGLRTGAKLF
jgi:predicted nucleic acid-binding protein